MDINQDSKPSSREMSRNIVVSFSFQVTHKNYYLTKSRRENHNQPNNNIPGKK